MTADGRLRVGVVGLGLMGIRHASALAARSDVVLCGGVDPDPAARARFGDAFGAQTWSRLGEVLDAQPDALVVCLPDDAHREVTCTALSSGCHVLVEKPLATTVSDARAMAAAAQEADRVLMTGFTLRFDPRYRAARAAVRDGRLGALGLVHARRNSARGAAERYGASTSLPWHVTSHDVDAIVSVTGQRIREVTARATDKHFGSLGHLDALGALLVLEGGAPVVVESSWVLPTALRAAIDSRLEVIGTEGVAEVAGMDEGLRIVDAEGFDFPDVIRYCADAGDGPGGALAHEVGHFLDVCRGRADPEVELADAVHTVEVVAALEKSLATRQTVPVASDVPIGHR